MEIMSITCKQKGVIFIILQCLSLSLAENSGTAKCISVISEHFDDCKQPNSSTIKKIEETFCKHSIDENKTKKECVHEGICRKTFNVSRFPRQLFALTMRTVISNMLHECCGDCAQCTVVHKLYKITELQTPSVYLSDIIFPILAEPSVTEMYNYYFIPVFDIPTAYYFTLKMTNKEMIIKLVRACIKMWPLLTICILLSLISGCFCMDHGNMGQQETIPKTFLCRYISWILVGFYFHDYGGVWRQITKIFSSTNLCNFLDTEWNNHVLNIYRNINNRDNNFSITARS